MQEGLVARDEDPDTTAHSSREELEEKVVVDEDVNEYDHGFDFPATAY